MIGRRPRRLGLAGRVAVGAAIAGAVLVGVGAAVLALVGPPQGTLTYTWSLGARYGLDANGDGIIDDHDGTTNLAADQAFIQNPTYKLTFDTCSSTAVTDRSSLNPTFRVTLTGPENKTVDAGSCKFDADVTKLGTYSAKVDVLVAGVSVDASTQTIAPKDSLVVSVGDSIASGEGNPDSLDPGLPFVPKWENRQCHRTGLAGPAQAALRMEQRDPHTSITFVHLACSGASITEGLLGSYEGQQHEAGDPTLKPQLDQVKDLVGSRPIDAMTVSIGANDAKFSAVVKTCLIMKNCYSDPNPLPGGNAKQQFDTNIVKLDQNYPLLDARLDRMAQGKPGEAKLAGKVFFTQYMDVTKDDSGSYCTGQTAKEKAAGQNPDHTNTDGLSKNEMQWADGYVIDALNNHVKSQLDLAATTNPSDGAQLVWINDIKAKFAKHGYCATDRWIRTLTESGLYERSPDGAFHPNAEGQLYGYATSIENQLAPALGVGGTALPLDAGPAAQSVTSALSSWVGELDKSGAIDQVGNAVPLVAKDDVQKFLREEFFGHFLGFVGEKVNAGSASLTKISERLDDLDGDGNPNVDSFGVPGLNLDVTGDVEPKLPSKTYDVTFTFKGSIAISPKIALDTGKSSITGQTTPGTVEVSQTVTLHIDLTKPVGDKLRVTIGPDGLSGTVKLAAAADFGGVDGSANGPDKPALAFNAGVLGLKVVGPVSADVVLGYHIGDAGPDGVIDSTELAAPASWVKVSCQSGTAKVDLTASTAVAGLTGALGHITMDDKDLCDGIDLPDVALGDLGDFANMGPADVINALAQLSTAISGIQKTADVDIPFVQESLSGLTAANERLVKFFVDNGLTDPANPMAAITYDPAKQPGLDTLDGLLPKIATSLGLPNVSSLNPRVVDDRFIIDLNTTVDPPAVAGAGTLDFGDQLSGTGLVGITGTAKATVDTKVTLHLGLGIDLHPDVATADRPFIQLGAGPELSIDAKVTAEAALSAKLSILTVGLVDDNASGPITLLDRKDPTKPLLALDINGQGDDRLTLSELADVSAIVPTINAKVPTFGLNATANLGGTPFAQGKVTVSWPDLTATTGPNALAVTVDSGFTNTLLPWAFDPSNPRAAVVQLLTAAHDGVAGLRSILENDPEATAALPIVGKGAKALDPMLVQLQGKLADLIGLTDTLTLEEAETRLQDAIGDALDIPAANRASLVTLRYEPQTATRNAALVADVALSVCSADRPTGCSITKPTVSVPLNLDLGGGPDSLAAVGTTANVTVSYDSSLKLGVGVELPRVAAAATPDGVPSVTGAPSAFVLDTSSFELGVTGSATGSFTATLGPLDVAVGKTTSPANPATASISARYALKSSTASASAPARVHPGAELDQWLGTIDPNPGTAGLHDTKHPAACPPAKTGTTTPKADACAALPIYINSTSAGAITFLAPDLLDPSGANPWVIDTSTVLDHIGSTAFQFSVLINGIDAFTARIEQSLKDMPPGATIPLLGSNPIDGANAIASFRSSVITPFKDLVDSLDTAGNSSTITTDIQDYFYGKIGPSSSVKLLQDTNKDGSVTKADIGVILTCGTGGAAHTCSGSETQTGLQDLQIKVALGQTLPVASRPLDAGFPGLRLRSDTGVSATVGWHLDLAFGIDRDNGFYIPVNAFGSQPELRVEATASLPANLDAELAFIPAKLTDLDTTAKPDVAVTVGVDLSGGGGDGKLSIGQLGNADIEPSLQVCTDVGLGMSVGGTKFPAISADLKITGGSGCLAGGVTGAPAADDFAIRFDNVRISAGSVISDLIGPAIDTIHRYTGPLQPAIDALQQPVPGVEELAKASNNTPPTWLDLAQAANDLRRAQGEPDELAMVRRVIKIVELANKLHTTTTTGMTELSLGSFDVDTGQASLPSSAGSTNGLIANMAETDGSTSVLDRLATDGNVDPTLAADLKPNAVDMAVTFPVLDRPQQVFELLLGKDIPLVRFEAGGSFLHVPVGPIVFPVGPAKVFVGGSFDLSGHFAAGFDTYGVRQAYAALTDPDPAKQSFGQVAQGLLGGFYIDDYDSSGKDVPELRVGAGVTVGVGVGTPSPVIGVALEGGVKAQVDFNLKTNKDGKLRIAQIVDQIKKNPDPVCMFDASAHISAFLQLTIIDPIKNVTFPIADGTILDAPDITPFCETQQVEAQPKLTGKQYSDGTLELFSTGLADNIQVTEHQTAGAVSVFSKGVVEQFTGVTKIFVDGAGGDDQILLRADAPRSGTIPAFVCGGAGKDMIVAQTGPSTVYGDYGPGTTAVDNGTTKQLPCATGTGDKDTIKGGPDADVLWGGVGNDLLVGNGGNDQIKGEGGTDTIQPGAGNDVVDGGSGDDTLSAEDRIGDPMTLDLRTAASASGATGTSEKDTAASMEILQGGPQNDKLYAAPGGTVIDGGTGDDLLQGGAGSDALFGSEGNDTLLGSGGDDLLSGDGGNDQMTGGAGADIYTGGEGTDVVDYSGEAGPVFVTVGSGADDGAVADTAKDDIQDADIIVGSDFADELRAGPLGTELHGGAGNDTLDGPGKLYGQDGNDDLRGSAKSDELYGGPGSDDLSGKAGADVLDGGTGDDLLDGGFGPDVLKGGDGFDTADYSNRTADVYVDMSTPGYDGELGDHVHSPDCTDNTCDDVTPDLEQVIGGAGNDSITGTTGDQTLVGGAGNDSLDGGGGTDTFKGGTGDDYATDGDYVQGVPDSNVGDTYLMGDGNDYVSGSGGDEHIEAGAGDDKGQLDAHGTSGHVYLDMGPGNDDFMTDAGDGQTIIGGDGNDTIDTTDGNKSIDMGNGDDVVVLRGGARAVSADGGPGNDSFFTGPGDDTVTDPSGTSYVQAGDGNDTVTTGSDSDEVRGEAGNDTITDGGNKGVLTSGRAQRLWGGEGDDAITVNGTSVGPDEITGDDGADTILGNSGPQIVTGGAGNDNVTTGAGDDQIDGGPDDDILDAGAGDDLVQGGDGTNSLIGGTGADQLQGGAGADTVSYAGRASGVVVTQGDGIANDGNATDDSVTGDGHRDEVDMQVDQVIGTSSDDVLSLADLIGGEPATLTGGDGRDTLATQYPATLLGGNGDDVLLGSPGVDSLDGGVGNDLLVGGDGADTEKGGDGNDRFDQGAAIDGGDAISGGNNADVADYGARPNSPVIGFTPGAGGANDGAPTEHDNIDATVETLRSPGTATPTPTITVTATPSTIKAGETVTVKATVTGSAGVPGGAIQLSDGGSPIGAAVLDGTGKATLTPRLTDVGDHTLAVRFLGDGTYRSKTSSDSTVAVGEVPTTATLVAVTSPVITGTAPTLHFSLTATSGSLQTTGSVSITEGATDLGSYPFTDGQGTFTLDNPLPVGIHHLAAVWAGDGNAAPSTSAAADVAVTATGIAPAPKIVVSTTPASPVTGTAFTAKAVLTPGAGASTPNGTVDLAAVGTSPVRGSVDLGTADVVGGVASLSVPGGLPGGTYTFTATYSGSPSTAAGIGSGPVTISRGATTTTLTSSANPTGAGAATTLTATVAPTSGSVAPTGSVAFLDGATVLATAGVDGTGHVSVPAPLMAGTHPLTAVYSGDDLLAPSTSAAVSQVVTSPTGAPAIATTTTVSATGGSLVAKVVPASGTAAGWVAFAIDGQPVGSAALTTGSATLAIPDLGSGSHKAVATYLGSTTHAGSASGALTFSVTKIATQTTVVRTGSNLVATVTPTSGTATGPVRFSIDGSVIDDVDLVGTKATLALPTLAVGSHSATAAYLGSTTHAPSTSVAVAFSIGAPTAPAAPGAPTVTASTATSLTLTWAAPSTDGGSAISAYRIRVRVDAASTLLGTLELGSGRTTTVTGLQPGRLYRFTVAAGNAVGYGPESSASAVSEPPFKTLDALITRQYQDLTNAAPTSTSLSSWRSQIGAGTKTEGDLADALRRSTENTTNVDPTARLYRAFLGRAPDAGGLKFWIGRRRSGNWPLTKMADSFASSNEFKTKYGTLTNRQFVTRIYTDVLGRAADTAGVDYWTKKLDAKTKTRGQVMVGFSESNEYKRKQAENTDASIASIMLLGRAPTAAEIDDWVTREKAGTTDAALLDELLAGTAYANHISG